MGVESQRKNVTAAVVLGKGFRVGKVAFCVTLNSEISICFSFGRARHGVLRHKRVGKASLRGGVVGVVGVVGLVGGGGRTLLAFFLIAR